MADEDKKVEEPKKEAEETPQEPTPAPESGHSDDPPKVDRTGEQFDKLKESNQELKQERDQYKKLYESYEQPTKEVPSADKFNNLSQPQVNDVVAGLVDEQGYMDGAKLTKMLMDMDKRAANAEQSAQAAQKQLRDWEETRATQKVLQKYDMLDPNKTDTFDEVFFESVLNELKGNAIMGKEPKEADYMAAADKWHERLYKEREMKKKDKEAQEKVEAQRDAAQSVKPTGSSMIKGYYEDQEDAELIKAIQQGKKGAIAERLKRRGL